MKKYKVIVNPTAGGGAGARTIPRIERLLSKYSLDFDIVCTKCPWHAAELAREAVMAEWDVIVAVGGDGTANEVINGLMEAKQAGKHSFAIGVLSVGRGNDFAHGVGVPLTWESLLIALPVLRTSNQAVASLFKL